MDYARFHEPHQFSNDDFCLKTKQAKVFQCRPHYCSLAYATVSVRTLGLLVCNTNAAGLLQRATVETDKHLSMYPPRLTTKVVGDESHTLRLVDSELYRVSVSRQKVVSRF